MSGSAEVKRAGWWWPKLWDGSAAEDGSKVLNKIKEVRRPLMSTDFHRGM